MFGDRDSLRFRRNRGLQNEQSATKERSRMEILKRNRGAESKTALQGSQTWEASAQDRFAKQVSGFVQRHPLPEMVAFHLVA